MDDGTTEVDGIPGTPGISRRQIIKRGALAGAVVWAVPVISTFKTPAGAQTTGGSPLCDCFFCARIKFQPAHGPAVFVLGKCVPTVPSDCACMCCCFGLGNCNQCGHSATACTIPVTCTPDPTCTI